MLLNSLVQPFIDNEFMLRALLAGVMVSVVSAAIGPWLVASRLAFLGDALGHGVLPGVALAVLAGVPAAIGAVGGAACVVGFVLVGRRMPIGRDVILVVTYSGLLGLGIVIVSRSDEFRGDILSVLFGEVLGVAWIDLALQAVVSAFAVLAVLGLDRRVRLWTLDSDRLQLLGYSPVRLESAMLVVVVAVMVVSFSTVGTLLLAGMLIAPTAAGMLICRSLRAARIVAVSVGAVSSWLGLVLSFHYDIAAGPAMVTLAALSCVVAAVVRLVYDNVRAKAIAA